MEGLEVIFGSERAPLTLKLTKYKGKSFVDVRKNFLSKEKEILPTRKGVMLNGMQFQDLLAVINKHEAEIQEHFGSSEKFNSHVVVRNLIGRVFNVVFENGKTTVEIDKSYRVQRAAVDLEFLAAVIEAVVKTFGEIFEEQESNEQALDLFNYHVKRAL